MFMLCMILSVNKQICIYIYIYRYYEARYFLRSLRNLWAQKVVVLLTGPKIGELPKGKGDVFFGGRSGRSYNISHEE